jgi:alpha-aminoadipate carrier protein LysW
MCDPPGESLTRALYNTPSGGKRLIGEIALTRCPECDAEIDLDEDEVEEGEIVTCPECDAELEVTQTHPVHFVVLSDDEDDEDEDDEEDEEDGDSDEGSDVEGEEEEEEEEAE